MSAVWGERQRDRLLALAAAVFAGSLIAGARGIEDSLLADAVGAGGVPQGVGLVVAVAALVLFAKSFVGAATTSGNGPAEGAAQAQQAQPQPQQQQPQSQSQSQLQQQQQQQQPARPLLPVLLRTAALVLILLAYGALLPWLGYALAVSLLVGASGWLAGAPLGRPLLACTALSGPGLWLLFDRLLQVRMPLGTLWG